MGHGEINTTKISQLVSNNPIISLLPLTVDLRTLQSIKQLLDKKNWQLTGLYYTKDVTVTATFNCNACATFFFPATAVIWF